MKRLKTLLYVLWAPIGSLFTSKTGFTVYFRWLDGWRVWIHGRVIPIRHPQLTALEYFRHFVPPLGGIVFDVGGELGYEARQFSKLVGPTGKVFVFECFPQHVKGLIRMSEELRNLTVVERACWNSEQVLTFYVGHTAGSNTAVTEAQGQSGQPLANVAAGSLSVQAETLDKLWREQAQGRPVDFLKMDIEGAELEALEGAKELLKNTSKAVIAAYHFRDGVRTAERVAEMLEGAGFRVRIDENSHVYAVRG